MDNMARSRYVSLLEVPSSIFLFFSFLSLQYVNIWLFVPVSFESFKACMLHFWATSWLLTHAIILSGFFRSWLTTTTSIFGRKTFKTKVTEQLLDRYWDTASWPKTAQFFLPVSAALVPLLFQKFHLFSRRFIWDLNKDILTISATTANMSFHW